MTKGTRHIVTGTGTDIRKILNRDTKSPPRTATSTSARQYLESGGELWRKRASGPHQKVPRRGHRYELLRVAHDQMGHKGVFSTLARLQDRFWWPKMDDDVKWYVRSCHECQLRQMGQYIAPPVVPQPATVLQVLSINFYLRFSGHFQSIMC